MSEKYKKALRIAVNVGCGFEGDAEDAAELLTLITGLEARIAELEAEVTKCHELQDSYCDRIAELEEKLAELVEAGNKMRDLIEQDYDGYLDETIEWRGVAEEADDVLQEREK